MSIFVTSNLYGTRESKITTTSTTANVAAVATNPTATATNPVTK